MSSATFRVIYDGPALSEHQMDVRDLAPALLALGDALEHAHGVLSRDKSTVRLKVKASFTAGSFGVELELLQSVFEQALDMFSGRTGSAAANLVTILGFGGGAVVGLVQLIQKLRGRSITKVIDLDDGRTQLHVGDEFIEVEQDVLTLYRDWRVRKALERAIEEPLQKPGIESFASTVDPQAGFSVVGKADASYFHAPPPEEEVLGDEEQIMNLQLVTVAFQEENKWRFSDGASSFYASVFDERFIERINFGEPFSKGDVLRARVKKRQWLAGENIRAEYQVLEVLEHRRAHAQLSLPMDPGSTE